MPAHQFKLPLHGYRDLRRFHHIDRGGRIMNAIRTASTIVGVVCVVVFVATGNAALGAVVKIVSPPTASGAEGDASITPNRDQIRVQYLIPASEFAGLPATHRRIVGFNFRSDRTQTTPVNW